MAQEQMSVEEMKRRIGELEAALAKARGERALALEAAGKAAAQAERNVGTSFIGDLMELARRARDEHQRRTAAGDERGGEQFAHHAQAFEYVASQIQRYLQKAGLIPPEDLTAAQAMAEQAAAAQAAAAAYADAPAAPVAPTADAAAAAVKREMEAPEAQPPEVQVPKGPSRYDNIEID